MKIKWSSLIYFLVVIALSVNSAMYWLKPKKVEVPVIDTLVVEKAAKPDTVIEYIQKTKVVVDTIYEPKYITDTDTILLIDTLYVYDFINQKVYDSVKDFKIKHGNITVHSYGKTPADSIKINFLLDFDKKISYISNSPEDLIFAGATLGTAAYGVTSGSLKNTLLVQTGVTATYLLYKFFLKNKQKERRQ